MRPSAFCRLEVDRKLVLGRRLYWQLGWLLALEDAIDVAGRLSVLFDKIRSIGDEATNGDEEAIGVDGGQSKPGGKRNDQIAMMRRQRARRHDQAAIRGARECRDGALDFAGIAHVDRTQIHPQRWRHGLDGSELPDPGGDGRIPKHGRPRHSGRDLLQQLQPFPAHAVFENREPSRVATRPCQAVDEAGADRVDDYREHDRHSTGRL